MKELNGKKFYVSRIQVFLHKGFATNIQCKPDFDSSGLIKSEKHEVMVEHIPCWIKDNNLQSFFSSHGYQSSVQLFETLQSFNHAIVTFECFDDAVRVVEDFSEKVIQIDHHDVQMVFKIDGRTTKYRKLMHTYNVPQNSLEEVKSLTGGDSNAGIEKEFAAQVTSPNFFAVFDEENKPLNCEHLAEVKDEDKISLQNNSIATADALEQGCDSVVFRH